MVKLTICLLTCHDIDQSLLFYRALGVPFQETPPREQGQPRYFTSQAGQIRLELQGVPNGPQRNPYPCLLSFEVDDLDMTRRDLEKLGVNVLVQRTEPQTFVAQDPDGRSVTLTEYVKMKA